MPEALSQGEAARELVAKIIARLGRQPRQLPVLYPEYLVNGDLSVSAKRKIRLTMIEVNPGSLRASSIREAVIRLAGENVSIRGTVLRSGDILRLRVIVNGIRAAPDRT
jgi:hypothetical protein